MKKKIKDYSGNYNSIHDFVSENKLTKEAEKLFGKNWEADNDIKQVQDLLHGIDKNYRAETDLKVENYIHVFKIANKTKTKINHV